MDGRGVPPEQFTSPGYREELAPAPGYTQAPAPGYTQAPPPAYTQASPPAYTQAPPSQASYPPPQEQPQPGYPQAQQPGYPAQQPYLKQQAHPQLAYTQQANPDWANLQQEAVPIYYPQQPAAFQIRAVQVQPNSGGSQVMTLAIIATVITMTCGAWLSLICTIPAIVFASSAQSAANEGNEELARRNKKCSISFSIVGIVTTVVVFFVPIITILVIIF